MECKAINGRRYFIYEKGKEVQTDPVAIGMMEQNRIDGLLPFRYVRQIEGDYFRYEWKEGETLEEWLERVQYRSAVIRLLKSLIFLEEEMEAWLMEADHICTEKAFVIVRDNQCEAAYLPVEDIEQGNILEMAREIVSTVRYAWDEDYTYLFDLQNAFGRRDIQNTADLKKWIRIIDGEEEKTGTAGEAEPEIDDPKKTDPDRMTSSAAERSAGTADLEAGREDGNDSLEGIFGISVISQKSVKTKPSSRKSIGHSLFGRPGKKKNRENDTAGENLTEERAVRKSTPLRREIINDLERGEATILINEKTYPTLMRVKGGREYSLNREDYVIGSAQSADIVVTDNRTISRKHAHLFMKSGFLYIEDLGSTNGTYVNGEKLRKMEPYKLVENAKIRISDEDFIFEVG